MKRLFLSPDNFSPAIIKKIVAALKKGEVLVLPTDTIYGFSCLADNKQAIKKIYRLKKRSFDKPFIILVANLTMAKQLAYFSPAQLAIVKQVWKYGKRPTTFILPSRGNLPSLAKGFSTTIALRLPKSEFLIRILKELKKPLVSTSLNISGQKGILNLNDLAKYWPLGSLHPDLIVDAEVTRRFRPSRVIDLSSGKQPKTLRT